MTNRRSWSDARDGAPSAQRRRHGRTCSRRRTRTTRGGNSNTGDRRVARLLSSRTHPSVAARGEGRTNRRRRPREMLRRRSPSRTGEDSGCFRFEPSPIEGLRLVVVELETHAVVDLVILEGDVVLVDVVPLLDAELLRSRARLRRDELLQVADGVVLVALDADLLALEGTGGGEEGSGTVAGPSGGFSGTGVGHAGRGTAVGARRRGTHQTVVENNLDHGESNVGSARRRATGRTRRAREGVRARGGGGFVVGAGRDTTTTFASMKF